MKGNDHKTFWSRWAARYDAAMSGSEKFYQNIAAPMRQVLNRNMTVLELACGTGLLSMKLAPMVKHLEATDFSAEMIEQAKKKSHSTKLYFSVQDATALPYAPESFDAVVISNALHLMPDPERALDEIKRVLKDGGILIAPTFTAAGNMGGRIKIRIMELAGLRVFHPWTPEGYLAFLQANGFEIQRSEIIKGTIALTYAEATKNN